MKPITLKQRVEYWSARSCIFGLSLLPERVAYPLMGFFAVAFLQVARRRMRIGEGNLRTAFGDELTDRELRRILRRSTANAFQNVLDLVFGIRLQRRGRQRERLDLTALTTDSIAPPFIGCTGHLGSWEAAGMCMGLAFGECHAIGRTPKNPLVGAFLTRYRQRAGLTLHPRRGGIRPLARALHQGKVALQVVDQNQRLRGVFVPFFGRIASTERAAATLAVRLGYPVLIGFAVRCNGRYRFRLELLAPLHAERSGDLERDVERMATRMNGAIETLVRRHPEQYLWIHDRYRTRPDGEGRAALVDVDDDRLET